MKRFVLSFLVICLCCIGVLAFSGCGNSDNPPAHSHDYTEEKAEPTYLKSNATCTAKAVYYKSCSCGEKGTDTFEYGNFVEHSWNNGVDYEDKTIYTCQVCGHTKEEKIEQTVTVDEWVIAFADETFENVTVNAAVLADGRETYTKITKDVIHSVLLTQETYYHYTKNYSDGSFDSQLSYHARQFEGETVSDWKKGSMNMTFPEYQKAAIQSINIGSVIKDMFGCFSYNKEMGRYENNSDISVPLGNDIVVPAKTFNVYFRNGYVSVIELYLDIPDAPENEKSIGYTYTNYGSTIIEAPASFINMNFELNDEGTEYCFTSVQYEFPCLIDIPETYNGLPVTSINQDAFDWNVDFNNMPYSITFPDTITSLPEGVFEEQGNLYYVKLPTTLVSIGENCFQHCSSLKGLQLPETLTTISNYAFAYSGLKEFNIPLSVQTISEGVFYYCTDLSYVNFSDTDIVEIGKSAFQGCSSLDNVLLPETLLKICEFAFARCSSLNEITIPKQLVELQSCSFMDCISLGRIIYNAEQCNENLSSATPFNISSDCNFEQFEIYVTIGNDVRMIPNSLFEYSGIVSVEFETDSICEIIGDRAFFYCKKLTNVDLPITIKEIKRQSFMRCSSLTSINFDELSDLQKIEQFAFYDTGLIEVFLGVNVSQNTFDACSNLTTVYISSRVDCFSGFADCPSLTTVIFEDTTVWTVTNGISVIALSSDELSNSTTAAELMKTYIEQADFLNYGWTWSKTSN